MKNLTGVHQIKSLYNMCKIKTTYCTHETSQIVWCFVAAFWNFV